MRLRQAQSTITKLLECLRVAWDTRYEVAHSLCYSLFHIAEQHILRSRRGCNVSKVGTMGRSCVLKLDQ